MYHYYKTFKQTIITTFSRKEKKQEKSNDVFKLISNCTLLHNSMKKQIWKQNTKITGAFEL